MAALKGGEDFGPFPVKEQLPGVDFCLNSNPPWHEAIALGFQHFLVMLGTTIMIPTILVPQMGGGPEEKALVIQTLLFVSGLNTLLQTMIGCRSSVVIGGSHAFIIPAISIIFSDQYGRIVDPYERFRVTMRAIQGAIMFASMLPVLVGVLGLWRIVVRFLSPLAAIPLVILTGLGLFQFGFPQLAKCVEVGLPALIVLVFISQYFSQLLKPFQVIGRRYAVILIVGLLWAFAAILTAAGAFNHSAPKTQFYCRTDRSGLISAAAWIRVPYPFQWGRPTLNVGNGFAMMAAAFVALVESTGTFITAARYGSATPLPPSVVSRGVSWLGVANFINGLFGAITGATASNAGLLGLNQVGSRRVAQLSAVFMLFFSVLGKFGALLASIPLPIFAALYCVLFAYAASAGLSFLQFCNLNSFRSKFILGFSLFMGLSIPQYFNEFLLVTGRTPVFTRSVAFNSMLQVIFSSPATVAGIIALFLDLTLHRRHTATRRDSGRHWWKKFRTFDADTRSEEFYSLPWGLNKYFPSL
uniref:Permease 1 n=1 Tax=Mesembryanthemum crystallinum TaxID=3544 RepID=Q9SBE1_MESCR|nr:permease 1 [Mesembryanthemum crystallinum]